MNEVEVSARKAAPNNNTPTNFLARLKKNVKRDKYLLILVAPVVLYFFIFDYIPMYGNLIAFKSFSPARGIWGSEWVGFQYFNEFFNSVYFWRLIKNTVLLSVYALIFSFPIPIIFALLLNEVKNAVFKRTVQTISYLPHFISLVVVVGIMVNFLTLNDGLVNIVLKKMGMVQIDFMGSSEYFRTLYVVSGIWQSFGWSSIIYIAALSSIDPQLYEAAKMDGANRWKQMLHITLPSLMPTAVMLFILALGGIMSVGFEKIILMYNPSTYNVADVISTYVYRRGIIGAEYSFSAAVGLFNSVINFALIIMVNNLSRRLTKVSLW